MRYLKFLLLTCICPLSFAETKSDELVSLLDLKRGWDDAISELTEFAKTPVPEFDMDLYLITTEHNENLERIKTETLSWEASKSTFVNFLSEKFTTSELDKIIAFFSSETGRKFLSNNDELTQKYQEQLKSKFEEYNELLNKENERYGKELQELMNSYEK